MALAGRAGRLGAGLDLSGNALAGRLIPGREFHGLVVGLHRLGHVGQGAGLSISPDNGATWTTYNTGTSGFGGNTVAGVYAVGPKIYAATSGGLSISNDNGATWTNYTTANGLGGAFVTATYAVGSTVYAATGGGLSIGSI